MAQIALLFIGFTILAMLLLLVATVHYVPMVLGGHEDDHAGENST